MIRVARGSLGTMADRARRCRVVGRVVVALMTATVAAGCGIAGPDTRAASSGPADVTSVDPCTLMNIQQQAELGRIDSVQPSKADPPDAACAYVHSSPPPKWTVVVTVGPDRGSKSASMAHSRPEEITVEGFPATRQQVSGGCLVEVQTRRVQGFAVQSTADSTAQACDLATRAASLSAVTVRRRH